MSDYKRFVSYIYSYRNGKKEQNTGFAKVESRNGALKISIQVKGIRDNEILDAYLFVRKGERLLGIYLNAVQVNGNIGELHAFTDSRNIEGSGYGLEEIAGLWLQGDGGNRYITLWDEEPLRRMELEIFQKEENKEAEGSEGQVSKGENGDAERLEENGGLGSGAAEKEEDGEIKGQQTAEEEKAKRGRSETLWEALGEPDKAEAPVEGAVGGEAFERRTDREEGAGGQTKGSCFSEAELAGNGTADVKKAKSQPNEQSAEASTGQEEETSRLLEAGADIKAAGDQPGEQLKEASTGQEEETSRLLEAGADIKAAGDQPGERLKEGFTGQEEEKAHLLGAGLSENGTADQKIEESHLEEQPNELSVDREEMKSPFVEEGPSGTESIDIEAAECQPIGGGSSNRNRDTGRAFAVKSAEETFLKGNAAGIETGENRLSGNQKYTGNVLKTERDSKRKGAEEEEPGAEAPLLNGPKALQATINGVRAQETRLSEEAPSWMTKNWMMLSRKYTHVQPFKNSQAVDCLRMSPRELGIFCQKDRNIGRNTFLLHGYYHFRHLLLIRCVDNSYRLAVPGYYSLQEQRTASFYGFPYFMETNEQRGRGKLGYWCRPVE